MQPEDANKSQEAARPAHPLAAAAAVIYATFALLIVAVPQAPANWLRGREPGALQDALLGPVEAVEGMLTRLGTNAPYVWAHKQFLALTGKTDD